MPDTEIYHHTAITTWSGFIYQGKVAIYHILKLLLENIDCNYVLQLDSLEDFSIIEDDNPVSMHQVKAFKSTYYSTYKNAFEKLNDKYNECSILHFHTAKTIHDKTVDAIEKLHPNIKIYQYDNAPNCPVGEIDAKIEALCNRIYNKHYSNKTYKTVNDYCIKTSKYLDQIVIRKIIEIHQKVHDRKASDRELAYRETIRLYEFRNILNDDLNNKEITPEYYLYLTIQDFHRYYQDFCIESEEEITTDELKKLSFYMSKIERFNYGEMVRFIKNIMPHREFVFENISDYKDDTLVKDEVKDAFFEILKSLKNGDVCDEKKTISWSCKKGYYYTPTTIDGGKSKKIKTCKRIIDNGKENDVDVLFENNNLITLEMNSSSIIKDANIINDINLDEENYKKITTYGKVKLISLEKTQEIIND